MGVILIAVFVGVGSLLLVSLLIYWCYCLVIGVFHYLLVSSIGYYAGSLLFVLSMEQRYGFGWLSGRKRCGDDHGLSITDVMRSVWVSVKWLQHTVLRQRMTAQDIV